MKYTPGPWEANSRTYGNGDAGAKISVWSKIGLIATVATIHEGGVKAEINACLIAAVPELLEAAKHIIENLTVGETKDFTVPHWAIEELRAAISKAKKMKS